MNLDSGSPVQDNSQGASVSGFGSILTTSMPPCFGFHRFQVLICELWLITGSHRLPNRKSGIRKGCRHFLDRWDGSFQT